jgi:hypothetical protein
MKNKVAYQYATVTALADDMNKRKLRTFIDSSNLLLQMSTIVQEHISEQYSDFNVKKDAVRADAYSDAALNTKLLNVFNKEVSPEQASSYIYYKKNAIEQASQSELSDTQTVDITSNVIKVNYSAESKTNTIWMHFIAITGQEFLPVHINHEYIQSLLAKGYELINFIKYNIKTNELIIHFRRRRHGKKVNKQAVREFKHEKRIDKSSFRNLKRSVRATKTSERIVGMFNYALNNKLYSLCRYVVKRILKNNNKVNRTAAKLIIRKLDLEFADKQVASPNLKHHKFYSYFKLGVSKDDLVRLKAKCRVPATIKYLTSMVLALRGKQTSPTISFA